MKTLPESLILRRSGRKNWANRDYLIGRRKLLSDFLSACAPFSAHAADVSFSAAGLPCRVQYAALVLLLGARLLWAAFIQRPKPIGSDPVYGIGCARIGDLTEEQFAPPIAIGIHHVDQLHARVHIKVL